MATLVQLQAFVEKIIMDDYYTSTDILGYLNQGVAEIAGGLPSAFGDFVTPPLPKLFSVSTVETATDAAYVSMPATFQRGLQFASNSSGQELEIYNSMIEFAADHPLMDGSGSVNSVIEQGGNLYYQKIPTAAETLTVHFYRHSIPMTLPTDTPDGIPAHLHIPLLVNYAAREVFNLIEDGLEGDQVNTKKHHELFLKALKTLEMSIPHDARSLFLGD